MTRHFTGIQTFSVAEPPPPPIDTERRSPGAGGAPGVSSAPVAANDASLAAPMAPHAPTNGINGAATAILVVVGGPDDGADVPVTGGVFALGRLPSNDMVINDPWVSRDHAEILRTPSEYVLRDLSSSNGTFVNNRNIGQMDHALRDGEQIRLGQSAIRLIFRFAGASTLKMDKSSVAAASGVAASPDAPPTLARIQPVAPTDEALDNNEDLIEGDVRVNVRARGDVRQMFLFVHELRQKPELRLLRLARGPKQDIAIWLGLTEVVPLKEVLSGMKGVADVQYVGGSATDPSLPEHVFNVEMSS